VGATGGGEKTRCLRPIAQPEQSAALTSSLGVVTVLRRLIPMSQKARPIGPRGSQPDRGDGEARTVTNRIGITQGKRRAISRSQGCDRLECETARCAVGNAWAAKPGFKKRRDVDTLDAPAYSCCSKPLSLSATRLNGFAARQGGRKRNSTTRGLGARTYEVARGRRQPPTAVDETRCVVRALERNLPALTRSMTRKLGAGQREVLSIAQDLVAVPAALPAQG